MSVLSSAVAARVVTDDEAEIRLDRWFRRHFPGLTQGALQKLCRTGQIRVDGRRAEAATRLMPGETLRIPPLNLAVAVPLKVAPVIDEFQPSDQEAVGADKMLSGGEGGVLMPGRRRRLRYLQPAHFFSARQSKPALPRGRLSERRTIATNRPAKNEPFLYINSAKFSAPH